MVDPTTLAKVNVFAILRVLEDLPNHDAKAMEIAAYRHEIIQFSVGRVGTARLEIGEGLIRFLRGRGKSSIKLWFPSPESLNAMFAGKGGPIPLKGFTKISYLQGPFAILTDRLTHFLRPSPESLADEVYRDANADLSLHAMVFALCEVGNGDREGRLNAARMPEGDVLIAVRGGTELTVRVRGGSLECRKGAPRKPRAKMVFPDLAAAGALLRGEIDSYTAIGAERLVLGGSVPMLDNLNKIMGIIPRYLR